jgi:hypothetical protein
MPPSHRGCLLQKSTDRRDLAARPEHEPAGSIRCRAYGNECASAAFHHLPLLQCLGGCDTGPVCALNAWHVEQLDVLFHSSL